jgi:filamentous hemagglutinin family protein
MLMFYKRCCLYSLFLIVVGFTISLSGCTNEENSFDILPNITLSVTSLDFGQVNVGRFLIRTVTINNPSNEDVIIERVTSTNESFLVGGYFVNNRLIDLVVPFVIEGNGAIPLYVGFYPEEEKEYTGTLVIESRDADSEYETDIVNLRGIGASE